MQISWGNPAYVKSHVKLQMYSYKKSCCLNMQYYLLMRYFPKNQVLLILFLREYTMF